MYICYGIHHLLNIVTADKDIPHGIMVRAIEPFDGIQIMLKRREKNVLNSRLTSGPGTLTQALGITINHNKIDLCGNKIWIEERGIKIHPDNIEACSRVGISYAGEYAKLPWRFKIKNNPWVSASK